METAYFRNIRKELIGALNQSKEEIRIAVAWFTNEELFETLLKSLQRGIKVYLIIIDDYINNGDYGLDFQLFINNGGVLMYGKEENPMHHKFCIIDDSILFTGSYNWTYYAENKNFENMVKFEDSNLIKQYIGEFELLRAEFDIVNEANKILLENLENSNFFSIKNYISLDLTYKAKETSNVEYIQEAIKLLPENGIIKKEYKSFNPLPIVEQTKPSIEKEVVSQPLIIQNIIRKTVNSIGIKSRINGIDGQFSVIIPKGSKIPCEFSHKYSTTKSGQKSMNIETFKGENKNADHNIRLGKFLINDLPPKPAGEASVTVTIKINDKLEMLVKARSNDTGNEIEANYYDKEIVK